MSDEPQRTIGRPSGYSQEIAERICEQIAEGMSVRSICKDESMPSISMVFRWLHNHPEFREQYARAKESQMDAFAEDILDISDDGSNDWMERNFGQQTEWVTNGEAIQRSKLRVDSRKWLMSKLKPKKYGDKQEIEHTGKMTLESLVMGSPEPQGATADESDDQ